MANDMLMGLDDRQMNISLQGVGLLLLPVRGTVGIGLMSNHVGCDRAAA